MLWRFLLTGPDDTPYEGGCFVFDIYYPPTYPAVCPKVRVCSLCLWLGLAEFYYFILYHHQDILAVVLNWCIDGHLVAVLPTARIHAFALGITTEITHGSQTTRWQCLALSPQQWSDSTDTRVCHLMSLALGT